MWSSAQVTHTYTYIYIYIYTCVCVYLYLSLSIYIYIYIYVEREREHVCVCNFHQRVATRRTRAYLLTRNWLLDTLLAARIKSCSATRLSSGLRGRERERERERDNSSRVPPLREREGDVKSQCNNSSPYIFPDPTAAITQRACKRFDSS